MLYDSVIEKIWVNFIKGGASSTVKRPTPQAFLRVCETFRINEEEVPSSRHLPLEIKSYLAERKIWEHFFGKDSAFPGVSPAPAIKSNLLEEWQGQHYREGYAPQFGWNPETGEPWLAIWCFAIKAYLALCGPKQEYIKQLNRLTPSFELYYERLGENGPLLLWLEFKYKRDIKIRDRQETFNCFRAFLEEWAGDAGPWSRADSRAPIPKAFEKFLERPTSPNQALALPEGFDFNLAFSGLLTALAYESSTSLTSSLKRRASSSSDESRRKRRGLGSSVLGSSQGLKEDPDEESIKGTRSNENQGQTGPGEPFTLIRHGIRIGTQRSPRVKEEIKREDEDINNIVRRVPPRCHDRGGQYPYP